MVNYSGSLDTTFAALADPTRRAILARLARGTSSVTELAEPFDISLPAISRHLRVLEEAGLLVREKEGRVHRITLEPAPIERGAEWIREMRRFWEAQLDAFAAYLERTTEEPCPPHKQSPRPRSSSSGAPSPRRGRKSSAPGPTRKR